MKFCSLGPMKYFEIFQVQKKIRKNEKRAHPNDPHLGEQGENLEYVNLSNGPMLLFLTNVYQFSFKKIYIMYIHVIRTFHR